MAPWIFLKIYVPFKLSKLTISKKEDIYVLEFVSFHWQKAQSALHQQQKWHFKT